MCEGKNQTVVLPLPQATAIYFPSSLSTPNKGTRNSCLALIKCSHHNLALRLDMCLHGYTWLPHEEGDTYLSRQHTKKYEDEHPLKRIEDCKQICSHHRSLYDMEDTKDPGSPKKEQESKSTSGTGPGGTLQTTCRQVLFRSLHCLERGMLPRQLVSAATAWEVQMHGLLFRVCCSTVPRISSHNRCRRVKE